MPPSTPSIEQLQRRIAELELLNARSAHDLKGPLVTIAGFLKELPASAKAGLWDEFDADVAHIARVVGHMQRMLDNLLQLARLDSSPLSLKPLALRPLLVSVLTELNETLLPGRLDITCESNWPLILGDEALLLSVWRNLLINATKYASDQGFTEVWVHYERVDPQLIVRVRDYGPGIPEWDRSRVFEPFVRLDATQAGTGLGLHIVQRAIGLHGGRVWIESPADGPGTVVCFTLPLAEV